MSILGNWLESLSFEINITNKCLRHKNARSTCPQCLEHCKQGAISIQEQVPFLNKEKCLSCGDCIISCPISAIEGIPANRSFTNNSLIYNDSFTPTIKELLIYKKRGITSIQTSSSLMHDEWELVIEETNKVLKKLDETPIAVIKNENSVFSRRSFFSSFQKQGMKLVKELSPAAWKVTDTDWILTKYYLDYQFYDVILNNENCMFCRACMSVCPSGVFDINQQELVIDHGKCVNCGLCIDVCHVDGLTVIPNVREKNVTKIQLLEKKCKDCGQIFTTFHQEHDTCFICTDRDPSWLKP